MYLSIYPPCAPEQSPARSDRRVQNYIISVSKNPYISKPPRRPQSSQHAKKKREKKRERAHPKTATPAVSMSSRMPFLSGCCAHRSASAARMWPCATHTMLRSCGMFWPPGRSEQTRPICVLSSAMRWSRRSETCCGLP